MAVNLVPYSLYHNKILQLKITECDYNPFINFYLKILFPNFKNQVYLCLLFFYAEFKDVVALLSEISRPCAPPPSTFIQVSSFFELHCPCAAQILF